MSVMTASTTPVVTVVAAAPSLVERASLGVVAAKAAIDALITARSADRTAWSAAWAGYESALTVKARLLALVNAGDIDKAAALEEAARAVTFLVQAAKDETRPLVKAAIDRTAEYARITAETRALRHTCTRCGRKGCQAIVCHGCKRLIEADFGKEVTKQLKSILTTRRQDWARIAALPVAPTLPAPAPFVAETIEKVSTIKNPVKARLAAQIRKAQASGDLVALDRACLAYEALTPIPAKRVAHAPIAKLRREAEAALEADETAQALSDMHFGHSDLPEGERATDVAWALGVRLAQAIEAQEEEDDAIEAVITRPRRGKRHADRYTEYAKDAEAEYAAATDAYNDALDAVSDAYTDYRPGEARTYDARLTAETDARLDTRAVRWLDQVIRARQQAGKALKQYRQWADEAAQSGTGTVEHAVAAPKKPAKDVRRQYLRLIERTPVQTTPIVAIPNLTRESGFAGLRRQTPKTVRLGAAPVARRFGVRAAAR